MTTRETAVRKSDLQTRGEAMMARHGFLGVPTATFEQAGREQLIALLREGLVPESKVLEFGCGCLRIAYWLVRFLDPDGYCGIEPARDRVALGREHLFEPALWERKRPRFLYNAVFDSAPFGTRFDFFVARSIWTHASKAQIALSLNSFVRDAAHGAVFLASYLPARSPADDYQGTRWVGTSHESDEPGVIRHALSWLRQQCTWRGLQLDELGADLDCDSQRWLRVRRGP